MNYILASQLTPTQGAALARAQEADILVAAATVKLGVAARDVGIEFERFYDLQPSDEGFNEAELAYFNATQFSERSRGSLQSAEDKLDAAARAFLRTFKKEW